MKMHSKYNYNTSNIRSVTSVLFILLLLLSIVFPQFSSFANASGDLGEKHIKITDVQYPNKVYAGDTVTIKVSVHNYDAGWFGADIYIAFIYATGRSTNNVQAIHVYKGKDASYTDSKSAGDSTFYIPSNNKITIKVFWDDNGNWRLQDEQVINIFMSPVKLVSEGPSSLITVHPGDTFAIVYEMKNNYDNSVNVGLGANLYNEETGNKPCDPSHDEIVNIPAQTHVTKRRLFTVPSNTPSGTYDLILGLWSGQPGNSDPWIIKTIPNLIKVVSNIQPILAVSLISPSNGATVSPPIIFKVRVTTNGQPVKDANVYLSYGNGGEGWIRRGILTDSQGYATCTWNPEWNGKVTFRWWAEAEKSGYKSGASDKWTLTYTPSIISAQITSFNPATGVYKLGDRVVSSLKFKNTGNVRRTFYVGYSVIDKNGKTYNILSSPVTLNPSEESQLIKKTWTVPSNAVAGPYKVIMAIWKDKPETASNPIQLDRREKDDSFEVEIKDTTPPPAPSLKSPTEGVTVYSTTPSFKWQAVTDPSTPVYYQVWIDDEPNFRFWRIWESDWTTSTSITVPPGKLEAGKTYYWRVRAKDSAGNIGEWSAVGTFKVPLHYDFSILKIDIPSVTYKTSPFLYYGISIFNKGSHQMRIKVVIYIKPENGVLRRIANSDEIIIDSNQYGEYYGCNSHLASLIGGNANYVDVYFKVYRTDNNYCIYEKSYRVELKDIRLPSHIPIINMLKKTGEYSYIWSMLNNQSSSEKFYILFYTKKSFSSSTYPIEIIPPAIMFYDEHGGVAIVNNNGQLILPSTSNYEEIIKYFILLQEIFRFQGLSHINGKHDYYPYYVIESYKTSKPTYIKVLEHIYFLKSDIAQKITDTITNSSEKQRLTRDIVLESIGSSLSKSNYAEKELSDLKSLLGLATNINNLKDIHSLNEWENRIDHAYEMAEDGNLKNALSLIDRSLRILDDMKVDKISEATMYVLSEYALEYSIGPEYISTLQNMANSIDDPDTRAGFEMAINTLKNNNWYDPFIRAIYEKYPELFVDLSVESIAKKTISIIAEKFGIGTASYFSAALSGYEIGKIASEELFHISEAESCLERSIISAEIYVQLNNITQHEVEEIMLEDMPSISHIKYVRDTLVIQELTLKSFYEYYNTTYNVANIKNVIGKIFTSKEDIQRVINGFNNIVSGIDSTIRILTEPVQYYDNVYQYINDHYRVYLKINSEYGSPIGGGGYNINEQAYVSLDRRWYPKPTKWDEVDTIYGFEKWIDKDTGEEFGNNYRQSNPILMNKPRIIEAVWVPWYKLKVSTSPYISAEVRIIYEEKTYSGESKYEDFFKNGSEVTVWVPRDVEGYKFSYWILDGNKINTDRLQILMNKPHEVIAIFKTTSVSITFSIQGLSQDISGVLLTVDGRDYYYNDFPVSFNWSIGSTHSFEWHTPLSSSENGKRYVWSYTSGLSSSRSGSITVSSEGSITAYYKVQYALYISIESGSGSTNPSPGSYWYDSEVNIQVSASPSDGYVFDHWLLDGSSYINNPISIAMDAYHNLKAYFNISSFSITFSVNGLSNDVSGVVLTVDGIDYSYADLPKSFTWNLGSTHTYEWHTPIPSLNSSKRYVWASSAGLSTSKSGNITVSSSGGSVIAYYNVQYKLYVNVKPNNLPLPEINPGSPDSFYPANSNVTLTAKKIVNYTVIYWMIDGSRVNEGRTLSLYMDKPHHVTVVYKSVYIHNGELVVKENSTMYIHDTYFIQNNGDIHVEYNGTLIIKNAVLYFNQTHDYNWSIVIGSTTWVNDKLYYYGHLIMENVTIISNYDFNIVIYGTANFSYVNTYHIDRDNIPYGKPYIRLSIGHANAPGKYGNIGETPPTKVLINNSQIEIVFTGGGWDLNEHNVELIAKDSVFRALEFYGYSKGRIMNCTLYHGLEVLEHSNVSISLSHIYEVFLGIKPSNVSLHIVNCTIDDYISIAPKTEANISIISSSLNRIWDESGKTRVLLISSNVSETILKGNSSMDTYNSTLSGANLYNESKIYVSRRLDIHTMDTQGENLSLVNITIRYSNNTLVSSKFTDKDGNTGFYLTEKIINATGEYYLGDYIVSTRYLSYLWSRTVKITNDTEITMILPVNYTITIGADNIEKYNVQVYINGTSVGNVNVSKSLTLSFASNTVVNITVDEAIIIGNNTRLYCSNNSLYVTITHNLTIQFNYTKQFYLTVKVNPEVSGSASPKSNWFNAGTQVNISVSPNLGYEFDHWEGFGLGSYTGRNNSVYITINNPIVESAYFKSTINDTVPPNTIAVVSGVKGNDDWYVSNTTIYLNATDNLSGVNDTYYRINNGPIKKVSVDGQPIITTEGENNTLEYWSIDIAGNIEEHKIITGIKIDKSPPKTMITISGVKGNDDWYVSNTTIYLNATDNVSRVAMIKYSFDNATWHVYTSSINIDKEGYVSLYYKSFDKAGNMESTNVKILKIDKSIPVILIKYPLNNSTVSGKIIWVNGTVGESNRDDLKPSINDTRFTLAYWSSSGDFAFKNNTPITGDVTVSIDFTDLAGNTGVNSVRFSVVSSKTLAEVGISSYEIPPNTWRLIPIWVNTSNLGAYDIKIEFDNNVINITNVIGGDPPFNAPIWNINSSGYVKINQFIFSTEGASGNITIAYLNVTAVGRPGSKTSLKISVISLVDATSGSEITPRTSINGKVIITPIKVDVKFTIGVDDKGYIAINISLDAKYSLAGGLRGYKLILNSSYGLIASNILGGEPPFNNMPIYNRSSNREMMILGFISEKHGPQMRNLCITRLRFRLNSSVGKKVSLKPISLTIVDASSGIEYNTSVSGNILKFMRGDVNGDDRISIADAMFIAQYLAGNRPASNLNLLNAASVKHDQNGDKISIADAMFIAQYLAGLRDSNLNLTS